MSDASTDSDRLPPKRFEDSFAMPIYADSISDLKEEDLQSPHFGHRCFL